MHFSSSWVLNYCTLNSYLFRGKASFCLSFSLFFLKLFFCWLVVLPPLWILYILLFLFQSISHRFFFSSLDFFLCHTCSPFAWRSTIAWWSRSLTLLFIILLLFDQILYFYLLTCGGWNQLFLTNFCSYLMNTFSLIWRNSFSLRWLLLILQNLIYLDLFWW